MAHLMANASSSMTAYFLSGGVSFLLRKNTGLSPWGRGSLVLAWRLSLHWMCPSVAGRGALAEVCVVWVLYRGHP